MICQCTTDRNRSSGAGHIRLYLFALALCMLAVGTLFAWWMAARTDRELRANLLQQTRMVSQAVDVEQVKTLTGTETDLELPNYLRLKERFAAVNSANPKSRFAYLMGRRADGVVFFFVDSEPIGSEDESPAGQIYEEVTAETLRAFDTQTEIVEGPVSDRWGEWVSVLVPLTDPKNGKLVALLGIDIDARSWKWEVAAKAGLPVGLALMLLGLLVLIFILAQSRRQILVQRERLQERTRQLLEAQVELVRQEKLAVLGQVAGSVGHELRNPLGVMSNAVYFLQSVLSDADETTREYLNIIKDEIVISDRIVAELLDSVHSKPPQPEAVVLREVIDRTLRQLTIPDSVAVSLDIPEALPVLRVDAMQINQVFSNLIGNGVEAMPDGGVLEIRAVENRQDGTITVSVRDSGSGMTSEQQAKLFEPLFSTKARGIGLGLVIVKNLIEANGGTVNVESEVGKGTVFTVTLPCWKNGSV